MVIAGPDLCPLPEQPDSCSLGDQNYITVHRQIYEPDPGQAPLLHAGADVGEVITQVRIFPLLDITISSLVWLYVPVPSTYQTLSGLQA